MLLLALAPGGPLSASAPVPEAAENGAEPPEPAAAMEEEEDGQASAPEEGLHLVEAATDPGLQAALADLYRLEYEKVWPAAGEFIAARPRNPFGHLFVAGALWWQTTTENLSPEEDPALGRRFERSVDRTVELADELIESEDPRQRADGYFAAGMALGLRGQWRLVQGRWYQAYRDGKKAMSYLRRCVEISPRYYDAYMGLGIFDYQVAKLPGALKLGARLLIRGTGNAKRGLKRLRLSVKKGRFASRQAAAFLLSIHLVYERDYPKALETVRGLLQDFPESPYYRFIEVLCLARTGDWDASHAKAQALFADLGKDPEAFLRKERGTLCGFAGDACLEEDRLAAAEDWLTRALAQARRSDDPNGWRTILRLYRGAANDMLGRRERALDDYRGVTALPDFAGSHARARFCMEEPCRGKRLDRTWSRREPAWAEDRPTAPGTKAAPPAR